MTLPEDAAKSLATPLIYCGETFMSHLAPQGISVSHRSTKTTPALNFETPPTLMEALVDGCQARQRIESCAARRRAYTYPLNEKTSPPLTRGSLLEQNVPAMTLIQERSALRTTLGVYRGLNCKRNRNNMCLSAFSFQLPFSGSVQLLVTLLCRQQLIQLVTFRTRKRLSLL